MNNANPSSGIFNISVKDEGYIRIQISDALGRKISDRIVQAGSSIDLSGKPGFYIITAFDMNRNEIGTCRQLILR
ncbi:MAG: hypothetical protein WAS28_17150 [Saprospiraceae bacterium]